MIRKTLVCGKLHYFFSSRPPDPHLELGTPIELEMPLETFWDLEKVVKDLDYHISAGESPVEVARLVRKLLEACAPHAVSEQARIWMQEKISELSQ